MTMIANVARSTMPIRRIANIAAITGVILIGVSLASGSFYTVDQSQRGALLQNGAYLSTVGPGLHFKLPWFQSVRLVDVQTHTRTNERVNSYSADQQPADVKLSVTYHIDPARIEELYSKFGADPEVVANRLLDPRVAQEFKVVFGRYTAVSAIQDRAKLNADAFTAIQQSLAGNTEVVLEGVQIENIDFSQQYIASIEARMQAEIEVQKIQQNAAREKVQAEITVIQAQAAADSVLARARADANATKLRGEADASAIRAKGDALKDNPGLVALTQAERWNGVLPTTMLPGGAVPMLSLGAKVAGNDGERP